MPVQKPRPTNEHRASSKAENRRARSKAARRGESGRAGDAVSTSPGTLRDKVFSWGVAPYPKPCYAFVTLSLLTKR